MDLENDMMIHQLARQFVSFLGVGGIATLFHYVLYITLVEMAEVRPYVASGVGYLFSAVLNYYLNYKYTFRCKKPHRVAMFRFFGVVGVGLLLNISIVRIGNDNLKMNYLFSQITATGIVIMYNFLCNKYWAFKESSET